MTFKRKLETVEAIQVTSENWDDVLRFVLKNGATQLRCEAGKFMMRTEQGDGAYYDTGSLQDWIVRYPDGRLSIVSSKIFSETYETL